MEKRNSELYGIQILRALAAIAVVFHHTLEESNGAIGRFSPDWLTTFGASGVDIFFVVSGFIMLYVSFRDWRQPPSPGNFLFRRATRIYPFYWLCCLAMLMASLIGLLKSHQFGVSVIVNSFLLLPGGGIIGVSWTLVYEVYFYLVFSLILLMRSERFAIWGATGAIIIIYLASNAMPQGNIADFLGNPLPLEFCFGLLLAHLFMARSNHGQSWPCTWAITLLGFVAMAVAPLLVAHPDTNGLPAMPRILFWGVPAVLAVAGLLNVGPPNGPFKRFLVLLGDASYALYLTHVFVMIIYAWTIKRVLFVSKLPQAPIVLIVVVIAVAIGIAAHRLVEKPLLALIRRITHRTPGHASPAGE